VQQVLDPLLPHSRKVAHEHVWWDQASLLVQVGLLDPTNLPVVGIEQAKQLLRIAQSR
jgi:carboxymethylenebutenolidase